MAPALSSRTIRLIEIIFSPREVAEVSHWLETECGNKLPFCDKLDEHGMERIRFAALKLSRGNIRKLLQAIDKARTDWRDLLMAADFGYDVHAHDAWAKEMMERR